MLRLLSAFRAMVVSLGHLGPAAFRFGTLRRRAFRVALKLLLSTHFRSTNEPVRLSRPHRLQFQPKHARYGWRPTLVFIIGRAAAAFFAARSSRFRCASLAFRRSSASACSAALSR